MKLSLCNSLLYLTQDIYRNTVALPWWESEMLKEMPDMMPTPIGEKQNRICKKSLSGILLNFLFQGNPETRVKKPLVAWLSILFAVIHRRKQNQAQI